MNRRSIMGKFAGLIALAFIASVCFFFLSYSISNFIIDRISDARIEESIVSELETYVEENRLRPESRKELWRWCRKGEVDIEVFVDGHLVFSSIFDVNNKQYNMEESEREKEKARQVRFGDVQADVVFYPYYHMYDKARAVEIVATILLFFAIIVIGVRKEIEYIHLITEEIQVLEGGDLTREITVRGDDEITTLAESVNEFRESMLNQMAMIEQLEKSNRRTLAEIAHDLRTPLTSLIMYLDFAQKEIEGREPTAELYLTRAGEKSVRLKNLLDENYCYTTMQDYFLMEKTKEPAYEVLRGFMGDINSGLEREGFFVRSEISFGHSEILVQRDAVARVFGNLMSNIIKYASKEDEVLVCCEEQDKFVVVTAVNKVRVFEGEKPESTGFGSRISKRLMEEMSGDYSTEESDGTFTTTLRFLKV